MKWLYDIVLNNNNEIVAMCFHEHGRSSEKGCLVTDKDILLAEGLRLRLSETFNSLQEAKDDAWRRRDQFHPSLD